MTRSLLCLIACLAVTGCNALRDTSVPLHERGVQQGAGCVDGFGPIQSGTEICVGYTG
ncbi:hypothetical protein [Jannaschia sp. CCS1]|uniref:hypothetical protein n=1 Tax=Jannaschia sp. (strain CCS1) TaxID=290400 RepID=UPI00030F35B4|nr:hypothetical protein [Jannaschia sp. CCS1]